MKYIPVPFNRHFSLIPESDTDSAESGSKPKCSSQHL